MLDIHSAPSVSHMPVVLTLLHNVPASVTFSNDKLFILLLATDTTLDALAVLQVPVCRI